MSPPLSAGLPLIVLPESPSPSSSLSLPTPFLAYHQFHHIIPSSNNAPLGEFSHPLPQPSRPLSHSLILFSPLSLFLSRSSPLFTRKKEPRVSSAVRASERRGWRARPEPATVSRDQAHLYDGGNESTTALSEPAIRARPCLRRGRRASAGVSEGWVALGARNLVQSILSLSACTH